MHLHYHGPPVESKAFPPKLALNLASNLARAPGKEARVVPLFFAARTRIPLPIPSRPAKNL